MSYNFSSKKIEEVKKLVCENVVVDELVCKTGLNMQDLPPIFHNLRRNGFRVFLGENQGHPSFCNFDTYRNQQGYNASIKTHSRFLPVAMCADFHLGSVDDSQSYIDGLIQYCIANCIYDVVILGDIIEGVEYFMYHNKGGKIRIPSDPDVQLEYVNRMIPVVKGLTYYVVFGNHDLYTVSGISYDLIKDLREKCGRTDFKVVGCEKASFQINKDYFKLIHNPISSSRPGSRHKQNLSFYAGSHVAGFKTDARGVFYAKSVPPLSNKKSSSSSNLSFPGFIDVRFEFNDKREVQNVYMNDMALDKRKSTARCRCVNTNIIENFRVRK